LIDPLRLKIPDYCDVLQAGALDGIEPSELPGPVETDYPLATNLHDGSHITVDETFITPLLQKALEHLESQGVMATLLLCAGLFPQLHSTRPLFRPSEIACEVLHSLGIKRIGILCPLDAQKSAVKRKWTAAGFGSIVWVRPLNEQGADDAKGFAERMQTEHELECVVLDYVGYPTDQVLSLRKAVELPVLDLGELAIAAISSVL
jgi:hypothetical protein